MGTTGSIVGTDRKTDRKMNRETQVVNIRREEYDVYIGGAGQGRAGYFGNPVRLHPGEAGGSTLEKYREYFYNRLRSDPEFKERIESLKGKALGCFCKPHPCHGDIIREYLDSI